MKVFLVSLLIVFFGSVLSAADTSSLLYAPCKIDDLQCLGLSTTTFLENTYKGRPEYGIVPIDPIRMESFDVVFDDSIGITYKYTNLTVRGLKKLELVDFKMDIPTNTAVLVTKANVNIACNILVDYSKKSKTFEGFATSKANVIFTSSYGFKLEVDDKGKQHFVVGPETITCKAESVPELELSPEMLQALIKDEDLKNLGEETKLELRTIAFCKIAAEAYKSVIGNLRAVAKVLPASAFFTSV